ncbi:ferric reductase family protein [Aspergillus clavatus NRRL 1]|uniref:ferric-chelate reductase (NADPH) n=1 Tax=Aspergillus clavatus (strain ATCC 1007 / CBS 513.65 / DSM 816 / NCTC 3887 / NRRL 1 / QM 1276 / 107) TaxID=344612 RepID=A1CFV9_ASPCL|nr:ferric-chelate reductase, putative [Aspergillus clavatus NRRL 1]EAW11758.1 ferric-chelate reductase, putative [Aspergillus clavatus NRRL 1]
MGVELGGPGVDHSHLGYPHRPMNPALATPLFVISGAFLVLFLVRMDIRFRHSRRLRDILQTEDQSRYSQIKTPFAWMKKHVLYAPLFSTRHSREFRLANRIHMGTIPLRLEAILLLGYIAVNIIFLVGLVDWWTEYQEKMYQLKYAAGHLAVMNSPALVLTAGRNNPLIPLLGIPFDTFNLLHRWVGRIMVAGAIIHMGCVVGAQAKQVTMAEITNELWHQPFYIYGMVALIAFVTIFFQSISPLRHAFYEAFLHFHIFLAIMAFVGLWYHLQGLAQQRVLLATLILWGLDRLARFGSIIWRNCGKQRTTATVELLPGDVARVEVSVSRPWKFKAGQYMYMYIPSLGLWTSHPFSVAWTSSDRTISGEKRDSSDSFNVLLGGPQQTTMSFLIKRRDGFTNKLLRKVHGSEEGRFKTTALAEGPFGGLHSLASYGTVLLIAGGIGITHPLSYLHEFIDGFSSRSIAVRKVTLVWVVRHIEHMDWIQPWMASILSHPAVQAQKEQKHNPYTQSPDFSLSIQVYVTSKAFTTDDYLSDESLWAKAPASSVPVNIRYGKPLFPEVLDLQMAQQVGAMAVSICGPGSLGDDVRKAVRERQEGRTVDLYEDTFS